MLIERSPFSYIVFSFFSLFGEYRRLKGAWENGVLQVLKTFLKETTNPF